VKRQIARRVIITHTGMIRTLGIQSVTDVPSVNITPMDAIGDTVRRLLAKKELRP